MSLEMIPSMKILFAPLGTTRLLLKKFIGRLPTQAGIIMAAAEHQLSETGKPMARMLMILIFM